MPNTFCPDYGTKKQGMITHVRNLIGFKHIGYRIRICHQLMINATLCLTWSNQCARYRNTIQPGRRVSVPDPGPMERSSLQIKHVLVFSIIVRKCDTTRVGRRTKVSSVDSSLGRTSCRAGYQQFFGNEGRCEVLASEGGKGDTRFF